MPDRYAPYRCALCVLADACGYHGILVFEGDTIPTCKHNEKPGKACHHSPQIMEPVHPVAPGSSNM